MRWCSGPRGTAPREAWHAPSRRRGRALSALAGWGGDWVGYLAALLTTVSFAPQAWLTWRTRDVRGISLGMCATFTVGIALWLAYGLLLGAWPLVLANSATLLLALAVLAMRLRYGRRRD